jgi:hypothetical protein
MSILRILGIIVTSLILILISLIIISTIKRMSHDSIGQISTQPDKCVDVLIVDTTFDIEQTMKYIQGVKIENGMSVIIHTNSADDGVYMIFRSQFVRLTPLIGLETYHISHGLYRNTSFTVPKPDAYGKTFLKKRGDVLNVELENFIIIEANDDGEPYNLIPTALYHVLNVLNESINNIEIVVHENKIQVPSNSKQRYIVCPQKFFNV